MYRYLQLFFSSTGRICRSTFFWLSFTAATIFILLFVFLEATLGHQSTLVLYPLLLWIAYVISSKRLHDLGISSWRLLILLIPLLGPLWIALNLLFRKGTEGNNQYGSDPLLQGVDYLTVNIHQGSEHA
jgi:uncharacterized membrane protein YhaH (DUF805 family)